MISHQEYDTNTVIGIILSGIGTPKYAVPGKRAPIASDIEILSIKAWRMDAVVAESFSNSYGNIFLVGDACHRFPPAGGFGMNTGIQDVHNLAWKLAMVLKNNSSPKLLTTYETGELFV